MVGGFVLCNALHIFPCWESLLALKQEYRVRLRNHSHARLPIRVSRFPWASGLYEQALKFSNGEHTRYAFNFAGPTHGLLKLCSENENHGFLDNIDFDLQDEGQTHSFDENLKRSHTHYAHLAPSVFF